MSGERWEKLDRIFAEALSLSPGEREAMLARACGSDESLRLEALSLLSAAADSEQFLEEPALEHLAKAMVADGWSLRPGERIGSYIVRELVGSGGSGEVWRATDERLERDVAIKVLLPHLSDDPDRLRRFTDEARTAGSLNHSNILSVYDVGEHGGVPFIVSELVEGESLRTCLNRGRLPQARAIQVGLQIARGLAAAHAQGIVHRDLKPENIFLRADGGVKLLDFGLAKLQARPAAIMPDGAPDTLTVGLAGTAGYMAPEQISGEDADARADLFALGVTLHEMLAGERPFLGASTLDTLDAILTATPCDLADLDPTIPRPLAAVVRRLLEKSPHARFQSAAEVAQALELLAHAPRRAGTTWGTTGRFLGIAAALAVTVAAAIAVQWRDARPNDVRVALGAGGRPAVAIMPFDNATGADEMAWLSTGVPNMLLTGLAQTRGLDIVGPRRVHEALEQAGQAHPAPIDKRKLAEVARQTGAGAMVIGSIYASGETIRIDAQVEDLASGRVLVADSVRGGDVLAVVDQLAARIRLGIGFSEASDVRRTADVSTASIEAYHLYSKGMDAAMNLRWADARRLLEQSVAIDPAFAEAWLRLAFVNNAMGRTADRRECLARAAAHSARLSERNRLVLDLDIARSAGDFTSMARLLDDLIERYPDVVDAYPLAQPLYNSFASPFPDLEKLLAITRRGATVLPNATETRLAYGYALLEAGRYSEALAEFEAYARLAPREPNPFDSMGETYLLLGQPERAIEAYSRALAIDPTFGSHNGRAYALATLGRYEEAIREGASLPHVRALVLSRAGRYREAARVLQAGIAQAEANENTALTAGLHLMWAVLAAERGDYARAARLCRAARERFAGTPGEFTRVGAMAADVLMGLVEIATGRLQEARTRLVAQGAADRRGVGAEKWWHHVLVAELAFAEGDVARAEAAFTAARPARRISPVSGPVAPLIVNNLWVRDAQARAAQARGDLAGAIEVYRRLLAPSADGTWVSVFEPRYVLRIAQLLERAGDAAGARAEYRRFLELWKRADTDLPVLADARRALARIGP